MVRGGVVADALSVVVVVGVIVVITVLARGQAKHQGTNAKHTPRVEHHTAVVVHAMVYTHIHTRTQARQDAHAARCFILCICLRFFAR